jgi:hypothetical protein
MLQEKVLPRREHRRESLAQRCRYLFAYFECCVLLQEVLFPTGFTLVMSTQDVEEKGTITFWTESSQGGEPMPERFEGEIFQSQTPSERHSPTTLV